MRQKQSLQEQVDDLIKRAEEKGLKTNFFFNTTLKRYTVQMQILKDLEVEIRNIGATVDKEYVKGRKNIYTNPAITEYNKTATAANGTVSTLINIIKSFEDEGKDGDGKSICDLMNDLMSDE